LGLASSIDYIGANRCDRDVASWELGRRGYDETSARDVARRIQIRAISDLDYNDLGDFGRVPNPAVVGVSFDGVPAAGSG